MILVSSTEPKRFHGLGKLSTAPEKFGVDFFWTVDRDEGVARYGVQRKELNDLIASVDDSRLAKETAQIKALDRAILVIEGKLKWTAGGDLVLASSKYTKQAWSKNAVQSLMLSLQDRGWWLIQTANAQETVRFISNAHDWTQNTHSTLDRRAKMSSPWGKGTDKEFAVWVLQSAPGIGPEVAKKIYDHVGPCVGLTVDDEKLLEVDGVGPKTVANLRKAFGG